MPDGLDGLWNLFRTRLTRVLEFLLTLYPAHFRREYHEELRQVLFSRLVDSQQRGPRAWLVNVWREIVGLVISVVQENWRDWRRKEALGMDESMDNGSGAATPIGISTPNRSAPSPGWIAGWMFLTTAALPIAWLVMAPLAVLMLWLLGLGTAVGFWAAPDPSAVGAGGFVAGLAVSVATAQWFLLRRWLPKAWRWIVATVGGLIIGGIAAALLVMNFSADALNPVVRMVGLMLLTGLGLGIAHWLVLRHQLSRAAWILAVDMLALASIGLTGGTITSMLELFVIMLLPGAISGVGLWLLMDRTVRGQMHLAGGASPPANANRSRRGVWLGLAAISLIPLFFFGIWAYAASQLALAKQHGIYDTPEQAIIASNSQGWGGAEVLRVENVHAGPDSMRGLPHVWFGGATVHLDRIPDGGRRDTYVTGSFYIHVADGWVHVPEGAFPPFIGWVMELYGMEGVGG